MDGFHRSVDFMVKDTEKLHAQVLHPIVDAININNKIWDMYFRDLLTRLLREGDDGNCGSAVVCDTICFQCVVGPQQPPASAEEVDLAAEEVFMEPEIESKTCRRCHTSNPNQYNQDSLC
ncbi:hypothetical protein LOK49_LG01G03806 [Camellia lanceoleosa]|uniref:Uncharacterized protein n=1 Tax=Camellia lanceoleosa TaxID=1840588 RepID=A0ACC0IY88_9ERIC|nr:hypothetical protein LOK49_LG01G03806 [Camellia lanceoleosa]